MSNYLPIPSLEEIEQINQKRDDATRSLEISNDHVKCQNCDNVIPLVKTRKSDKRKSKSSVKRLEFHINRIRKYAKKCGRSEENNSSNDHPNSNSNSNSNSSLKKEYEKLARLKKEEKENDFFRRLPLLCTQLTGYRWICSSCYDKAYRLSRGKA